MPAIAEQSAEEILAQHPHLILYDGVCNICNGGVRFVLQHEREPYWHFAALQTPVGQKLSAHFNMPLDNFDTMIVIDNGEVLLRSDAAVRVNSKLKAPWRWIAGSVGVLPRKLRDAGYRKLAANRFKWFGERDSCPVPGASVRARFI